MSLSRVPPIDVLRGLSIYRPTLNINDIVRSDEVTFQFTLLEIINLYIYIRNFTISNNNRCSISEDIIQDTVSKYIHSLESKITPYLYPDTNSDPLSAVSSIAIPILDHIYNYATSDLFYALFGLGTTEVVRSFEPSTIHTIDLCICLSLIHI